jgi:serine protease inhibitor
LNSIFRDSFNRNIRRPDTNEIANGILQLATEISNNMKSGNAKNEIFSPISIAGALSLLLLGAKGQTENELANVLHVNNVDDVHGKISQLLKDLVSNQVLNKPIWRQLNSTCFDDDEDEEEDLDES